MKKKRYVVVTSDGKVHETDCVEYAIELIDQYGAEIVSENVTERP